MRRQFEGKLLVTDIDGTLIESGREISRRNLEAIRRFQEKGGLFAFATGRSRLAAQGLFETLKPNAPCIFINGAAVYDPAAKRYIYEAQLDKSVNPFLLLLAQRFATTAVELFLKEEVLVLRENGYSAYRRSMPGVISRKTTPEQARGQALMKALFMDTPERIEALNDYARKNKPDKAELCRSCAEYFEVIPQGVNKGIALQKLRESLRIERENTYAIGDHENDLELLAQAGFSAAPQTAIEPAKERANLVVGSCAQGAVADFIEYLENHVK